MGAAEELEKLDESLGVSESGEEITSQEKLEEKLAEKITGRLDGLRHTVLSLVVEGRYDTAIAEISFYANSDYKLKIFQERARKYFNHTEELIRAIESKIKFCQTRTITRSQKHQLYLMVIKHFHTLTETLKKVERIENDIRVSDLKSTVWVLKALTGAIGFVIFVMATYEAYNYMGTPYMVVINDAVTKIFQILGI